MLPDKVTPNPLRDPKKNMWLTTCGIAPARKVGTAEHLALCCLHLCALDMRARAAHTARIYLYVLAG